MRPAIIAAVLLLSSVAHAYALTLKDVVDLTRAGLGDEVLLALIEVDNRVFPLDTNTLAQLKAAGVSEKVIVALVRSGRTRPAPEELAAVAAPPPPQVIVVEQPGPTIVHEVPVPVPIYVAVPTFSRADRRRPAIYGDVHTTETSPRLPLTADSPYRTDTPKPSPKAEPVYWGWDGKLRPDAWKPK